MGGFTRHLKPSHREILALAMHETDPREAQRFEPICRGPLFAVIAIASIGLLAIPSLLVRAARASTGRDPGSA